MSERSDLTSYVSGEGAHGGFGRWVRRLLLAGTACGTALALLELGLLLAGFPATYPVDIELRAGQTAPLRGHWEFPDLDVRYNRYGLRYPDIPEQPEPDEQRVLVVGDSFTEGGGVLEDDAFPQRLERLLSRSGRRLRFINAGVSGTGPIDYGRTACVVGLRYRPRAVLIVLHANDVANTGAGVELAVVPAGPGRFALATDRLVNPGPRRWVYTLLPHTYLLLHRLRQLEGLRARRPTDLLECIAAAARESGLPEDAIAAWRGRMTPELIEHTRTGRFNAAIISYGLLQPDYLALLGPSRRIVAGTMDHARHGPRTDRRSPAQRGGPRRTGLHADRVPIRWPDRRHLEDRGHTHPRGLAHGDQRVPAAHDRTG